MINKFLYWQKGELLITPILFTTLATFALDCFPSWFDIMAEVRGYPNNISRRAASVSTPLLYQDNRRKNRRKAGETTANV
jgi:hypothetical protein